LIEQTGETQNVFSVSNIRLLPRKKTPIKEGKKKST